MEQCLKPLFTYLSHQVTSNDLYHKYLDIFLQTFPTWEGGGHLISKLLNINQSKLKIEKPIDGMGESEREREKKKQFIKEDKRLSKRISKEDAWVGRWVVGGNLMSQK